MDVRLKRKIYKRMNSVPCLKLSKHIFDKFSFAHVLTACQSSTDRKGGQAVPSLCNQCWGFCGGPTAIPDYSQNVRTSHIKTVDDQVNSVNVDLSRWKTLANAVCVRRKF